MTVGNNLTVVGGEIYGNGSEMDLYPASTSTDSNSWLELRTSACSIGGPEIKFDMEVWEFGEINEGDVIDTIFTFTNVGKEPLIISNAKAGCGCTVPQWPKEPIAPGETGKIAVKFNSKGKPGPQNKPVTLTMNTTPNTMKLRLVGKVNPLAK